MLKALVMTIMVTGGAGYIGNHTMVQLQEAGHAVVVFDNLCNSHSEVFNQITGISPVFVKGDLCTVKPQSEYGL